MKVLKTAPDTALAGTPITISGTGLPANKDVLLTWSTANVDWVLDPRPDSVDYLGRKATKFTVAARHGEDRRERRVQRQAEGADATSAASTTSTPSSTASQVAKGGFLIARSATITPKQGPIGTPITITYTGLGSTLYEGGASLLYDNKYVGAVMANWTRGVAVAHIRATGPVGKHTIEVDDAITFKYLNIQQSPIPWGTGYKFNFTVTKDNGPAHAAHRLAGERRADASTRRTTLNDACSLDAGATAATATLSVDERPGHSKVDVTASGLTPNAPGRPRVGDRRRQPRQLHRHLLVVRHRRRSARRRRPPTAR